MTRRPSWTTQSRLSSATAGRLTLRPSPVEAGALQFRCRLVEVTAAPRALIEDTADATKAKPVPESDVRLCGLSDDLVRHQLP
jgi:hypothetical protein